MYDLLLDEEALCGVGAEVEKGVVMEPSELRWDEERSRDAEEEEFPGVCLEDELLVFSLLTESMVALVPL